MLLSSLSTNQFSEFTFNFSRINLDGLFVKDDRCRMLKWIDESRQLLIEILRRNQAQVLHIWFNIYDNVYEQLDSSMTKAMCLELLRASPTNHKHIDPCLILNNLISSFEISIPHPESLQSPSHADLCVEGLAQRVFDFDQEYASSKIIDGKPTILLNHQIFDVNRKKQDDADVIVESDGILLMAIILAHEITHTINLTRSINEQGAIKHDTPKLLLFRSYSESGMIDAGNLIERLLLDGELHLSKPPPSPPTLFLTISADGSQVALENKISEECIKTRSFMPVTKVINSRDAGQLISTKSRKTSSIQLPALQPLFHFKVPMDNSTALSSPPIPVLKSMMYRK